MMYAEVVVTFENGEDFPILACSEDGLEAVIQNIISAYQSGMLYQYFEELPDGAIVSMVPEVLTENEFEIRGAIQEARVSTIH